MVQWRGGLFLDLATQFQAPYATPFCFFVIGKLFVQGDFFSTCQHRWTQYKSYSQLRNFLSPGVSIYYDAGRLPKFRATATALIDVPPPPSLQEHLLVFAFATLLSHTPPARLARVHRRRHRRPCTCHQRPRRSTATTSCRAPPLLPHIHSAHCSSRRARSCAAAPLLPDFFVQPLEVSATASFLFFFFFFSILLYNSMQYILLYKLLLLIYRMKCSLLQYFLQYLIKECNIYICRMQCSVFIYRMQYLVKE